MCVDLSADGCEPNPCQNNGTCEPRGGTYRCDCPEPYTGQNCQKVTNFCKNAKCGMGECVITSTAPYYECKCRHPYQQPNCRKGKDDCYEGNGETYRGNVSSAEDGSRCLYWSSYQVLKDNTPYENIGVEEGLGSHRYCRGMTASEMKVVLGGQDIEKQERYDQSFDVEDVIDHENYRETEDAFYNDIEERQHSSSSFIGLPQSFESWDLPPSFCRDIYVAMPC
ncbi:UNVERIFIED_CONTAM: hypothetical protein FKN15_050012 [Acipenser sinensis]